jgi:hypothetical protein
MTKKLDRIVQVASLVAGLALPSGCWGQGDDCDLKSDQPELSSIEQLQADCAAVKSTVYTCILKDKSDSENYDFDQDSLKCSNGQVQLSDLAKARLGRDDSYCVRGSSAGLTCNF